MLYGPHGCARFLHTRRHRHAVHARHGRSIYNSDRTGVRLIGPSPQWARPDGGEAGLHPSNIHDNAYAVGTIDFTGDMPIILGPDGPSLGGFVCPATIAEHELWKIGQAHAPATRSASSPSTTRLPARRAGAPRPRSSPRPGAVPAGSHGRPSGHDDPARRRSQSTGRIRRQCARSPAAPPRPCADGHAGSGEAACPACRTSFRASARCRSHFDADRADPDRGARRLIVRLDERLGASRRPRDPDRGSCICRSLGTIRRPDWQSSATCRNRCAPTRRGARAISSSSAVSTGWTASTTVKRIVFDATLSGVGLGDVYLGAPVATPIDPRHRLVTTKYNPARTWTPENAVGIGGAYMCVYGMEGPGGYQFVGRTMQVWNTLSPDATLSAPASRGCCAFSIRFVSFR